MIYFIRLSRFVLVKFTGDTIVQPVDTEWFEFYGPGQDRTIQPISKGAVWVSFYA